MRRFLLLLIGGYRRFLSGSKPYSTCRFRPTCSEYAAEAISRRGAARGLALSFGRILRCHPFGGQGFDPVPAARRKQL